LSKTVGGNAAGRRSLNVKPTQMANPKRFCSDEAG
jgi:hypothetical protein